MEMEQEQEQGKQIRLTAAEMSQLYNQYMNDSASVCMLTFFLEKAEDTEIKPVIEHALELSQAHIKKLTAILTEEQNSIPHGFKLDEDVDINAPRLYSDGFVLQFIYQMAQIGLKTYSTSLGYSSRKDISSYYGECLSETIQLYEMSKDLLLSKGIYQRAPYLTNLEHVQYVQKQGFVWDLFGEKRPLIGLEIANLYANIQRNALGSGVLFGFSQVAQSKDATQFFLNDIKIAKEHMKALGGKLEASNLPIPMTWSSGITKSTTYTFSDKIMMFYTTALIALSIGYYGTAIAQSPRADLVVMYNKLILQIQKLSGEGAKIMINNKWLEQPPLAPDRDELAKGSN